MLFFWTFYSPNILIIMVLLSSTIVFNIDNNKKVSWAIKSAYWNDYASPSMNTFFKYTQIEN